MNLLLRLALLLFSVRRREPLSIWDTAVTPFRVAPTDLDYLRHMNNSKYLAIMDLGRMDLMLRSGFWDTITEQGWYPVVAGQTITYRSSLTLGQRFELRTRVLGMDERWIYMEQTFVRGEAIVAQAVVRARFLRREGGSVAVSDVMEALGGEPRVPDLPGWVSPWSEQTRVP